MSRLVQNIFQVIRSEIVWVQSSQTSSAIIFDLGAALFVLFQQPHLGKECILHKTSRTQQIHCTHRQMRTTCDTFSNVRYWLEVSLSEILSTSNPRWRTTRLGSYSTRSLTRPSHHRYLLFFTIHMLIQNISYLSSNWISSNLLGLLSNTEDNNLFVCTARATKASREDLCLVYRRKKTTIVTCNCFSDS